MHVCERFQRKEQTLAVGGNLEDAYSRVQFKQLMELLVQYGVSLTLSQGGSQQHYRKEKLPCDLQTGSPSPNN